MPQNTYSPWGPLNPSPMNFGPGGDMPVWSGQAPPPPMWGDQPTRFERNHPFLSGYALRKWNMEHPLLSMATWFVPGLADVQEINNLYGNFLRKDYASALTNLVFAALPFNRTFLGKMIRTPFAAVWSYLRSLKKG
jgi:hypothetical protein